MTLNKQALRVPERKRHDWSSGVMRYCDFCTHWAITVKHEDGGNICANCCDVEYTSVLKDALEVAIERAESAEKRLEELEANTITVSLPMPYDINVAGERIDWDKGDHLDRDEVIEALRAAGIKIKGE